MVWDACFGNRVAAFRLCLVIPGKRHNGRCIRTKDDIYLSPLSTAGICSRRRGRSVLWALLIGRPIAETIGVLCDRRLLAWLHRRCPAHRFGSVIKRVALTAFLVLLIAFLLAACTSPTDETISSPSSSQSAAAVPGEKLPDDQRYAPGPMGSSNVRW
jgi:hypothetical protein